MYKDVARGVAKNFSIMLLQQFATWIATLVLMIFMPRMLGPARFGELFLGISIIEMFKVVVAYGSSYYITKKTSRHPESTGEVIIDGVALRGLLSVVSIIVLLGVCVGLDYSTQQMVIIMILSLSLIFHAGTVTLSASYQGHQLIKYMSIGYILEKVFATGLIVPALFLGATVTQIAVIYFSSSIVTFLTMTVHVKKMAPVIPTFDRARVMSQLKEGIPYFLFTAFSVVYYRIGSVILSKMSTAEVVGWYGGAVRLFDTFMFIPALFSVVVYPVLSKFWKSGDNIHAKTTQKGLELMIIAGTLIAVSLYVFARPIVSFLYGLEGFGPTIDVLQVLSLGLIVLYVDIMLGTLMLSADKQKEQSILALVAIPVNVSLNYFAIPFFQERMGNGGVGSGLATVVTELFIMMAMIRMLPKGVLGGFRFLTLLRCAVAGTVTGIAVVGLSQSGFPLLGQFIVTPILYFTVLILLRAFDSEDRELGREILARVRERASEMIGR